MTGGTFEGRPQAEGSLRSRRQIRYGAGKDRSLQDLKEISALVCEAQDVQEADEILFGEAPTTSSSLVDLRWNFVDKLLQSVDDIR